MPLHRFVRPRAGLTVALAVLAVVSAGYAAEPGPDPRPEVENAIVLVRSLNSLRAARGSGCIIGDGGWVVTASHVVSAQLTRGKPVFDSLVLVYPAWTGRPMEARVVAADPVADIALLRLPVTGLPTIPIEGFPIRDPEPALAALKERPLRLYGFPLTYGNETVASLARPEHNDGRLREIARRGETNLCVLSHCPDAQPGWSGGPIVALDRGTLVAIFHSLYRPTTAEKVLYPAGSLSAYLGDLLTRAQAGSPEGFARPQSPPGPRPPGAAERLAREMRSLSAGASGAWGKAADEQRELVRLDAEDIHARIELGRCLIMARKPAEAIRELREAARRAPKSMLAQLYLGQACYLDYDADAAIDALRTAITLGPEQMEPRLVLAEVLEASEKRPQAEEVLREAARINPDHPGVQSRLGSLLVKSARPSDGFTLMKAAAEAASTDSSLVAIPLAYARALDVARKTKDADGAYRQAVRCDPDDGQTRYYFAVFLLRQNKVEEAQLQVNLATRSATLSDSLLQAFRDLQLRINERGTTGTDRERKP